MKIGTALIVTPCGPDTNPKESGEYNTSRGPMVYEVDENAWYHHGWNEPVNELRMPTYWLKPVGPVEDL